MNSMGASCSMHSERALGLSPENQMDESTRSCHIEPTSRASTRHSVVLQFPDHSISSLYPIEETYVLDKNNKRSPKRLSDLCIESLCRALPFLEGDLPGGIPKEIVDDIVRSLLQHSALNAATLRAIRNREIGSLILAGCRGVSDHWFEPFSSGAAQPSPQLSHCSDDGNIELMECINLVDDCTKTREEVSDLNSCSTSSFLSATSTISSPVTTNTFENEAKRIQSLVASKDKILDENIINNFSPITVLSSHLLLLDLRGSQGLTDRGLMQLTNLESLEVAKFDNCHSLVGSGFVALASSSRLHSISLANCRRLIDEAVVNISHLVSLENLNLDGCRCITDHSLAAMSSLYNLRKLDLSQCDLITDEGLENLEELDLLEELSLGWCRMISDKGLNIVTGQPGRSKLRVIRLARCKITDEGIMCLSRLMSLSALDLNGCSSIGSFTLGTVLEDLKMLEYLDVSFCPGILRSSWQGKINRLKSLELCYSGVRDLHLSRLNDLSTLEELNLDSCPVGDWAIAHLAESCVFPNLRNLDLADTDLTDIGMAHLPKFTKLTRLSLFHCNISNAGLRHLTSMSSLEILNLDSRDISDDGLIVLQALTNLKALDVFSARITDRGCSYLAKVKSLETLDLCGGGIGDLGCISLATLDNLTSLNLSQNERITNRGVAALAALSTLRALNLSNTRINSGALRYLSGLKHLESLAMYGCSGICDNGGLIEFQEALPKLKCLKLNMPNDDNGIIHSSKTEFMDYDDKDSETRHFFPQIDDLNSENDDLSMYSEHD